MAGLGFKDFAVGEVLTSANVDGYLMQQTVMRFADSGARGSALGTATGTAVPLAEGMVSYLDDVNQVQFYTGTDWSAVSKIVQVVSTTKTDTFTTTSNSLTAVTGLSASITPATTSSKVLIIAKLSLGTDPALTAGVAALRRGGTAIFIGDADGSRGRASSADRSVASNYQFDLTMVHLDSPATTSSTTYDVAVTNAEQNGQTVAVNRSASDGNGATIWRTASSITLMEVVA